MPIFFLSFACFGETVSQIDVDSSIRPTPPSKWDSTHRLNGWSNWPRIDQESQVNNEIKSTFFPITAWGEYMLISHALSSVFFFLKK